MSFEEIASWIFKLAQSQPNQARNAYSAVLLIPGWEQVRFSPLIKQAKKLWETSVEKYADFWDAKELLLQIASTPLDWENVQQIRDRTIIILRIFHLCRSIDLARSMRTKATQGQHQFWCLRRKGARSAKFEELISLPETPNISPTHLLLCYVQLTSSIGKKAGPVFLSLHPPYRPLSANSIGRITKNFLSNNQIPTNVFGAHSTRGAAVKMYKSLGLSSEMVCELGAWKNFEAFSKHYLRIGAALSAGKILSQQLVHRVPSWESAEQGRSSSPGRGPPDLGRRDLTGEAQNQDGPNPPTQEKGTPTGGGQDPESSSSRSPPTAVDPQAVRRNRQRKNTKQKPAQKSRSHLGFVLRQ
jgi:hypothetical protein